MWPAKKIDRSSEMGKVTLSRECLKAREMMFGFIDGTLNLIQSRRMNEHIERCADCKSELATCRRAEMALRRSQPQAPYAGDMLAEFHVRVAAVQSKPQALRRYAGWIWAAPAFSLCLLGLLIMATHRPGVVSKAVPGVPGKSAALESGTTLHPQTGSISNSTDSITKDRMAMAGNGPHEGFAQSSKLDLDLGGAGGRRGRLADSGVDEGMNHPYYLVHRNNHTDATGYVRGGEISGGVSDSRYADGFDAYGSNIKAPRMAGLSVGLRLRRSQMTNFALPSPSLRSSLRSVEPIVDRPVALGVEDAEIAPESAKKLNNMAFAESPDGDSLYPDFSRDNRGSDVNSVSIDVVDDTRGFTARARIASDNETRDGVTVTVIDAEDSSAQ